MSTGQQFFELQSPRDMLEKARREFSRLKIDLTTDNLFNFVVTVHHIKDYAEKYGIPQNQLPTGGDFQLCRMMCNLGKHFSDNGQNKDNNFIPAKSGAINSTVLNEIPVNGSRPPAFVFEGKTLNVLEIAERLINEWDAFLTRQGL